MTQHTGNLYESTTIRLDGNAFENCTFDNCTLEFGGTDKVGITGCKFNGCQWVFVEAAATTIRFMSGLYTGFGPDGQKLVEDTFNNIRAGNVQDAEMKGVS